MPNPTVSPLRYSTPIAPLTLERESLTDNAFASPFTKSVLRAVDTDVAGAHRQAMLEAQLAQDDDAARAEAYNLERAKVALQRPMSGPQTWDEASASGNYGDYVQNALGNAVGSMAKPLIASGGLGLVGGVPGSVLGSLVGSTSAIRNAELVQYMEDPQLASLSAKDQLEATRKSALLQAIPEAILPAYIGAGGKLPGALSRMPGALRLAGEVATEAGTEGLQDYLSQRTAQGYFPDRQMDWDSVRENAIQGAIGGGGLGLAMHHDAGHSKSDALSRQAEAAAAQTPPPEASAPEAAPGPVDLGPNDGGAPGFTEGMQDGFNAVRDSVKPFYENAKQAVDDTIKRASEVYEGGGSVQDIAEAVFNRDLGTKAAEDLAPDAEDSNVLNAADPAEAIRARDAGRPGRTAEYAQALLDDPETSDFVRSRIEAMNGDFARPANQIFVAGALSTKAAGKKLMDAVEGFKSSAARQKNNLEDIPLGEIKPLVDMLSERLGPDLAAKAPTLARQLTSLSARLDPDMRITPDVAQRMQALSSAVDDDVLDTVAAATGNENLKTVLAKIRAIPGAAADVRSSYKIGPTFLDSMLTAPLGQNAKREVASYIDQIGPMLQGASAARKTELLSPIREFFGGNKGAQIVAEHYGNLRREAFRIESDKSKARDAEQAATEDLRAPQEIADEIDSTYEDTGGADFGELSSLDPTTEYQFRDAASKRPFRRFEGTKLSNRRTRREGTRALLDAARADSGRSYQLVPYGRYLKEQGISPEVGYAEMRRDIEGRIEGHKTHKEDRSKHIAELENELTLHDLLRAERGYDDAKLLNQYEVIATQPKAADDLKATHDDLKAMRVSNSAHPETRIAFTSGKKRVVLSAFSMLQHEKSKRKYARGNSHASREDSQQMFQSALASVLNRGDLKLETNDLSNVVLDPQTGARVATASGERISAEKSAQLKADGKKNRTERGEKRRYATSKAAETNFRTRAGFNRALAEATFGTGSDKDAPTSLDIALGWLQSAERQFAESKKGSENYQTQQSRVSVLNDYIENLLQRTYPLPEWTAYSAAANDEAMAAGKYADEGDLRPARLNFLKAKVAALSAQLDELGDVDEGSLAGHISRRLERAQDELGELEFAEYNDSVFTPEGKGTIGMRAQTNAETDAFIAANPDKFESLDRHGDMDTSRTVKGVREAREKQSTVGDSTGQPGMDRKTRAAVAREIHRLRGKDIKIRISRLIKDLGYSGSSFDKEMPDGTVQRWIEIAIDAKDPMGVAWHESLHDFFASLEEGRTGRSIKRDLTNAANAPHVKRQLEKLLAAHPKALEQIKNDPEERVAYMYQFWAAGELSIGPTGTNIFQKLRQFFFDMFKIATGDQRAEDILTAFHEGKFANERVVAEVLADLPRDTVRNRIERFSPALSDFLHATAQIAPDRLRDFQNEEISALADKLEQLVRRRFQQQGVWENKLAGILAGTTAVERRTALENMQAMKDPSSPLEKALAGFYGEMHDYMTKRGVKTYLAKDKKWVPLRKVGNYFPRSFDRSAIQKDKEGFTALLEKNGVDNKQAKAITEALIQGDGRLELAENEHSLGFTPFAKAVIDRQLTFINKSNASDFAKYQVKDLMDISSVYIRQAVHRAEYTDMFDNDGAKILEAIARSKITDKQDLKAIDNSVQAMEGTLNQDKLSLGTKNLMSGAMTLQNITLLPLAIFSQSIDPIVMAARTGDLKDAGNAYITAMKRLVSKDKVPGEELAEILGIVSRDSVLEAMGYAYGSTYMNRPLTKINRAFFKWNGMQGWNNSMRIAATVAGEKYLLANRSNAKALEELGLEPSDIQVLQAYNNGVRGEGLDYSNPKIREAMYQFVDQAVLRPSAANRPVWMSDPRFQLVAHLKQFTFAMHNVVLKRATQQADEGNHVPWAILGLTMPVILAADMAKFALTGTMPANWGFTDYLVHSVERSGILGLGDFTVQATRGMDAGAAPGEGLLGPTLENLFKILRWAGGDPRVKFEDVLDRTVPGAKFV